MIKTILRTVYEMCPKKQFYHHKNVWTVSLVKFEFLGYNVKNKEQTSLQSSSLGIGSHYVRGLPLRTYAPRGRGGGDPKAYVVSEVA